MRTTIDEAGRIVLPEDLRRQLGVNPGDEVLLEERGGEWVIKSSRDATGLCWEGQVLVHKGSSVTADAIEDILDQVRSERYGQIAEGLPK